MKLTTIAKRIQKEFPEVTARVKTNYVVIFPNEKWMQDYDLSADKFIAKLDADELISPYFEYYPEFGANTSPVVHKALSDWLEKNDLFWEWENPEALAITNN